VCKEVDEVYDTPIHAQAIAGGTKGDLEHFSDIIKDVVEESIDVDIKPYTSYELKEEERKHVVIVKTDAGICNRKSSEQGMIMIRIMGF
jgi:uncharacterized Fe-S cluster-containing radical SAM superfamily enzyme